jgi:hypothetical protein
MKITEFFGMSREISGSDGVPAGREKPFAKVGKEK